MTAPMACDDVRELLAGYLLGALEPEEMAAVEEHLRAGHEHDAELAELRATVLALDTLAEERAPSPALADRIAAIGDGARAPRSPAAARPAPRRRVWFLAAAAALLVAVFAAGWLAGSGSGGGGTAFALAVQGPGGELLKFTGVAGEAPVSVTMAGLDRLDPGQAYELWAIRDGRWLRIGVCNTNAQGGWIGTFPFALAAHEEVALTVEPAGGSPAPTAPPLMRSRF